MSTIARGCDAEEGQADDPARACFQVVSDESSGIVTDAHVERTEPKASPVTAVDSVEVALARAIEGATAGREWAVVAQLARELEARRLARADVPSLDAERARRSGR